MKKITLILLLFFAVTSCNENKKTKVKTPVQQLDSIISNVSLKDDVLLINGIQNSTILYQVTDAREFAMTQTEINETVCEDKKDEFIQCVNNQTKLNQKIELIIYKRDSITFVARKIKQLNSQ